MKYPVVVAVTGALMLGLAAAPMAPASGQTAKKELAVQKSPSRVMIYPRRGEPGPNAHRECRAQLVQQARPSGTVIVPVMHCWWQ
ncbi:MAG: hypothetical protein GC182_18905 [Rhodopseudomonas sp.]|nr:hypothetical protein [Rhodopseudomonas sp.]